MLIDRSNIDYYLDKFFEGETTCSEEAELSRFFREEEFLPEHLYSYRSMFSWIDSGMPEKHLEEKRRDNLFRKILLWGMSTAAMITISISFAQMKGNLSGEVKHDITYLGSYVKQKGVKNKDMAVIMPEIQLTLMQVDEMENRLRNMNFDRAEFRI